jgi:hypothetical protein
MVRTLNFSSGGTRYGGSILRHAFSIIASCDPRTLSIFSVTIKYNKSSRMTKMPTRRETCVRGCHPERGVQSELGCCKLQLYALRTITFYHQPISERKERERIANKRIESCYWMVGAKKSRMFLLLECQPSCVLTKGLCCCFCQSPKLLAVIGAILVQWMESRSYVLLLHDPRCNIRTWDVDPLCNCEMDTVCSDRSGCMQV